MLAETGGNNRTTTNSEKKLIEIYFPIEDLYHLAEKEGLIIIVRPEKK